MKTVPDPIKSFSGFDRGRTRSVNCPRDGQWLAIELVVLGAVLAGCSGGLVVDDDPETYEVDVTATAHSDGKVTTAAVCEPGDVLVSGSCQIWGSTSELTNDGAADVQDHETCDGCTVEGWVCGGYRGRLRASAVCEVGE